jgi:hypothetical protein
MAKKQNDVGQKRPITASGPRGFFILSSSLVFAILMAVGPFARGDTQQTGYHLAETQNEPEGERHPLPNLIAFEKGVSLGLFATDPEYDYRPMLLEIADHGASHVMIAVAWYQDSVSSHEIAPRKTFSPSNENILRTIRQAQEYGLAVTLLPIVRLTHRSAREWRGRIQPRAGIEPWFNSYGKYIAQMSLIAADSGAFRLSVGSELLSMEKYERQWRALIGQIRQIYKGRLLYSANWDHFDPVSFWDAVDDVGVTGYFELAQDEKPKTQLELMAAWSNPLKSLAKLRTSQGRPLILTEIGYPSKSTAARYPWDETRDAPTDHALQARLYTAFCSAFSKSKALDGFYFWNWFGFGGVDDTGYSPRSKPAALELRKCMVDPKWGQGRQALP